jgi:hypothetical protein
MDVNWDAKGEPVDPAKQELKPDALAEIQQLTARVFALERMVVWLWNAHEKERNEQH